MIELPKPTRPALAAFWLVAAAGAAVLIAAVLTTLGVRQPVAWGILAAALVAVPGLLDPARARRPYEAWNRLSRAVRRIIRRWLIGTIFVMIGILSRAGTSVAWTAGDGTASGWAGKRQPEPGSERSTADVGVGATAEGHGFRALASWAGRSENPWVWALIPALALLKAVEGRPGGSLGGNVYTLY